MLADQDPKDFAKPVCLVGESVFFNERFGIDYSLALAFKRLDKLHEQCVFAYIAEPAWRKEDIAEKKERRDKLVSFGCPFINFPLEYGLSAIHLIRQEADYIYAPAFMAYCRQKFSPKVLNKTKWIIESGSDYDSRLKTFFSMETIQDL